MLLRSRQSLQLKAAYLLAHGNVMTAEEKARIIEEETFRAHLRRDLALELSPKVAVTWKQKIWEFLNSTFGLWFLSSVLLAVAVKNCDERKERLREEENKQNQMHIASETSKATADRICTEISYRFSSTLARLKAIAQMHGDATTPESQKAIVKALDIMQKPSNEEMPPLFLEYKNYSGLALIAELQRHVSPTEKPSLVRILRDTSIFLEEQAGNQVKPAPAKTVATELLRRLRYSQWNGLGFPYTTCKNENPFC
jgi:hypothetical protein